MQHIIRGRQQGKTYDLLKWAEDSPYRTVLFVSQQRLSHALSMANHEGIQLFGDQLDLVSNSRSLSHNREYAIDDLALALHGILGVNVSVVADTGSIETPKSPGYRSTNGRNSVLDPSQQRMPTSAEAMEPYYRELRKSIGRYTAEEYSKKLLEQVKLPPFPAISTKSPEYSGVCLGGPLAGQVWVQPGPILRVTMKPNTQEWLKLGEGEAAFEGMPKHRYEFTVWDTKTRVGTLKFWAAKEDEPYWLWKLQPYLGWFLALCPPKVSTQQSGFAGWDWETKPDWLTKRGGYGDDKVTTKKGKDPVTSLLDGKVGDPLSFRVVKREDGTGLHDVLDHDGKTFTTLTDTQLSLFKKQAKEQNRYQPPPVNIFKDRKRGR